VVLSKTTLELAAVVGGLSPHLRVLYRRQQAMTAEVNQAFDFFQNDYDQAPATYFASILN
jgi:predicted transcriptional regulator